MIERVHITVEGRYFKWRLEDFLLDKFSGVSKMYLRDLVKQSACEVNGRHENIGFRLKTNDFIEITLDRTRGTAMRAENIALDIVFEDDDLIVVNKPAGMLVHPSHRENSGTLMNALSYWLNRSVPPAVIRPGLIHRLDKQTSGLVVVAKNARTHRIISDHWMKKRVEKRYLALVEGVVTDDDGTIEAPIGRFAELKYWSVKEDGKHAETRYWVRKRFDDTTLLELEPVTGRTNQLRIHCELIGHPIVGDVQRGGREFERLCLHAHKIAFPHANGSGRIAFESECEFAPILQISSRLSSGACRLSV